MTDILDRIEKMLADNGTDMYGGEAVTQTEHALQCAALAEAEGASPKLIASSLLHDIGHLLEPEFEEAMNHDEDMVHEDLGEAFLESYFDEEVTQPVKLHVDAKRYLCATDETYFSKLSPASVHSLKLQGGPMDEAEVSQFEMNKYYKEALRLRVWDDLAKDPEMKTNKIAY